jgi:hypothetical protein
LHGEFYQKFHDIIAIKKLLNIKDIKVIYIVVDMKERNVHYFVIAKRRNFNMYEVLQQK